jgi:alpha-tubulin suppressor-like RCC1 family protein
MTPFKTTSACTTLVAALSTLRSCIFLVSGLGVVLVACGSSNEDRAAAANWLTCDECLAGELDSLLLRGNGAVPVLAQALGGPSPAHVAAVREQFRASYAQRADASHGRPLRVTEEEYVRRFLGNYIATYQSRAAVALGRLETWRARRSLRSALRNEALYRPDVATLIRSALTDTLIIVSAEGQTDTVGHSLAAAPSVRATGGGRLLGGRRPLAGVEVHFLVTAGGGTVSGARQITDSLGIATVGSWTLGVVPGANALTARAGAERHPFAQTTISATSVGSAGPVLTVVAGDAQHAIAGTVLPTVPKVRVTDGGGTPMQGAAVSFTVLSGGGAVGRAATTTDVAGVATAKFWRLGDLVGQQALRIAVAGVRDTVFVATGTPVPARLVPVAGGNQVGHIGALLEPPPAVRVEDGLGAPVAGVTVAFSVASGDGQLTGAIRVSDSNGIATLGSRRLRTTPGVDSVIARAPGLVHAALFVDTARVSWTSFSAGNEHVCAIDSSGPTYCWGSNAAGQLGSGTASKQRLVPTMVIPRGFVGVSAGGEHSCAVRASGMAFCWGLNRNGTLGDSTRTSRATPRRVSGGLRFTAVIAGTYGGSGHTCGITTDSSIYCWGLNTMGQLGIGTVSPHVTHPAKITGADKWSSVVTGTGHTCALRADSTAYCWGLNSTGALGDGTRTSRASPTKVVGPQFTSLTAGALHTCGISTNGKVFCWGYNGFGQLGTGSLADTALPTQVSHSRDFTGLSGGRHHTCGIDVSGQVFCWGRNHAGQLGDGTNSQYALEPVRAGTLTNSRLLAAGGGITCAVANDEAVYCWGWKFHGQFGNGTAGPQTVRSPLLVMR